MKERLFFRDRCPKCHNNETFNIQNISSDNASKYAEAFVKDEWREYDYELFSITSNCNSCKHYVSGNVAVIWDELTNSNAVLSDFASDNGEIKQNENIFIEFDVPPLIPQQHISSPPVANMHFLYEQASRCYDIHAWDAVVILCRRIIDIQSAKMWRQMFGTKPNSNLYKRVYKILARGEVFDKDIPIEEQLDFTNENHKLLYDIEKIRFWGNFAAHSELCVHSDDAESAIIYTQSFMNSYYKWSKNLQTSDAEI
ncbi:hypothetical protein RT917_004507 [Vibrio parahaemolyticus]|nr:hypothetical protein [Vibrio parahaemolyticus]